MTPSNLQSKRFIVSVCLSLAIPSVSFAQETLEEIVVTAQKREASLQDTAVSVAAFTGDQLERSGVTDAVGLSNLVTNVTIGTESARDAVYVAVRGISQNERRNTDDATTPFNIDGASIPRPSGINSLFYDLERVEVLRGPQGTLYGKNSTSGVVNVITKKPTLEETTGNIEVSAGNFSEFNVKGAINIPLSETVATRIAFTRSKRDGYRDNGPLVEDGDDADDFAIRGHLLWEIGENTSLLLTADHYAKDAVGAAFAAIECESIGCAPIAEVPSNPEEFNPLNTQGLRDNEDNNFKFQLDHSFNGFDLFWLGSYRKHEREFLNDLDGSASLVTAPNGAQSFLTAEVRETTESESYSSEVRLTSNGDGPFNWILGAYYLDETINGSFNFTPGFSSGMGNLRVQFDDIDLTYESFGLFANTNYELNDNLTLNLGVRYTDDEKDKGGVADPTNPTRGSFQVVSVLQNPNAFVGPSGPAGGAIAQVSNPSWSDTTWAVGLDWNVNDNTLAYAKVSTGFKAGGFNRGSNDPLNPSGFANVANLITYDPETVTSYELGWKTDLLDGRGRINFSLFYNEYEDKVESAVIVLNGTPLNTAVNAADATIYGFEFESSWLYGNSGGRVDINLGYLDATYDTFDNLPEPIAGGVLDVSGGELANAPDLTANIVWVPIELNVMNGVLSPRLQLSYKSDYLLRPHGLSVDKEDSYTRTNASLYWEADEGNLYGEVYVNNIEDEAIRTLVNCTNISIGPNAAGCQTGFQPPRTYGIKVGYRF